MGEDAEKDGQTLLVPTNAAFEKLPDDVNTRLLEDQPFAQKVVQRHILDEVLSPFDTFRRRRRKLQLFFVFCRFHQVLCCSGIA